jgi:hypothetical protein
MFYQKFFLGSVFLLSFYFSLWAQKVDYAPAHFGPNAMPVPEVTDGKIPDNTQFSFSTDYSFGCGDKTLAWRIDAEIPLLPKFVSVKAWMVFHEFFWLTPGTCYRRNINPSESSGWATGDFYAQTRISILREKKYRPQIIATATIRAACGGKFDQRRYFDTPAYCFEASVAKSFPLHTKLLNDIRIVGNIGFLCWETTNSSQDDTGVYGLNLILSNSFLTLENQIGGYWGRLNNGDRPLTFRTKLTYNHKYLDVFFQYQYGIFDFPYHQIRMGVVVPVKILTPKYSLEKRKKQNENL